MKFDPSQGPVSGFAIDDVSTFRLNFYKKRCVGHPSHPTPLRCGPAPGDAGQRRAALLRNEAAHVGPAVLAQAGRRRTEAGRAVRGGQ